MWPRVQLYSLLWQVFIWMIFVLMILYKGHRHKERRESESFGMLTTPGLQEKERGESPSQYQR